MQIFRASLPADRLLGKAFRFGLWQVSKIMTVMSAMLRDPGNCTAQRPRPDKSIK